jgi:hypothetical protein
MKKAIVLLTTVFALLLASFAFVGGASADENAEHACYLAGNVIFPGETLSTVILDVNGNEVYSSSTTNDGSDPIFVPGNVYVPAVSGTEYVTITGPFGTFSVQYRVNDFISGECFDDGRLNSRADRDLAAPVAIYIRFAEDGDGFDGFDIYDINQVAGTGTLSIRVTEAELNDAADEAVASGANVTVAQEGDILFTVLASSTADQAICQVNAVEAREGKPYEFRWVCLS